MKDTRIQKNVFLQLPHIRSRFMAINHYYFLFIASQSKMLPKPITNSSLERLSPHIMLA